MSLAGIAIVGCGGSSSTSSTTPSSLNPLQTYVSQLEYTKATLKQLNDATSNQQSFSIGESVVLSSIQISYYESSNCSTLNSAATLNGPAQMSAGTYTSTNPSNYSLCSNYPGGCDGLLAAVQAAPAWSMQYTYYYTNGTSYQSVCMNNPNNPIGKSAEFIANYTSGVAACTAGNSCGFSQAYAVLPLGWLTQNGAESGTTVGVGIKSVNSNIYTTGTTTVGLSGQVESSAKDSYVAKYSESGTLVWSRQFGAGAGTLSYGVGVDNNSNSYIAGYTFAALPGQTQVGVKDYYITKYDTDGNMIWLRQVGCPGAYCPGYGISTNAANGDSYVTGTATGALAGQTLTGNEDYFVTKYDTNGNLIWTRQVGAAGGLTRGLGITNDSTGNSYITGYTTVGLSGQTQNGTRDYYVAKYDTSGNLMWTRQVGTAGGSTNGAAISTDGVGVYVTGYTTVGISGQTQTGINDYFVAKYDVDGNLIWTRQVGAASSYTSAGAITVNENVYLTGSTRAGISGQTQNGIIDYFIAEYDVDGNLISTIQTGVAGGSSSGNGIIHANQNSYVTGSTNAGLSGQTQLGTYDYFITKIPQ